MSNEKTLRTLQRMIERMERTLQYCQNESFASVQSNLMLQEACVFNLLQIGELAHNGLDEAFVQAHPEQPWRQIYGMRNRIAHDYEGIRLQIVWQTISEDFPLLIQDLKRLLADL